MKRFSQILLIQAFVQPACIVQFSLNEWDIVIRQARSAGVLARLGFLLDRHNFLDEIPEQPCNHLKSAMIYFEQFEYTVEWEIKQIQNVLEKKNIPVVLLKGAAYHQANDKAARGRIFSDIDILVHKEQLEIVEKIFLASGWLFDKTNPYDQEYYRKWMHELPPMRHLKRGTSLDIHHNLLPLTSSACPDINKIFEQLETSRGGIQILAPADRVIHSAVHLFYDGEFEHGFRDISDIDLLLREFSKDKQFWDTLILRAETLKLEKPVYYALRYSHCFFNTPVPEEFLERINTIKPGYLSVMDFLFLRALMPDHPSCNDRWTGLARFLLYLRAHWLKMPLYLLIPHLLRKGWMRISGRAGH